MVEIIANETLVSLTGDVYYVELWDHESKINNLELSTLYTAYPWTQDSQADVILVKLNDDYSTTQRVEDPEILRKNYSLPVGTSIEDIMNTLRKEIYDEFQRQKEALNNPNPENPII